MRSTTLDEILLRFHQAEKDLELELDRILEQKRKQFQYQMQRGRVVFENNVRSWQRQYKTGVWRYLLNAPIRVILSAPVIYGMLIPIVLIDASVTLYQHICFRIYSIPLVRRSEYLVIDRHHLAYLNVIEKINCMYCSYGNGVLSYASEISARTERYWCPIKHARRALAVHGHYHHFLDYGDAETYRKTRLTLRQNWSESDSE
jgi:hypothetical protein